MPTPSGNALGGRQLVDIHVDRTDVLRAMEKFNKSSIGYPQMVGRMLGGIAREYLQEVRDAAPKSTRRDRGYIKWQSHLGGPLAESIHLNHPNYFEWEITEGAEYGKWVREGNGPATYIGTQEANALWWPGLGEPLPWVGVNPYLGIRLTRDRTPQEPNPYHEKGADLAEVDAAVFAEKTHIGYFVRTL